MPTAATISEQTSTAQDFGVNNWCLFLPAKALFVHLGQSPKGL